MKTLLLLNPESATPEEVAKYDVRSAARAIVLDDEGKTALLHVRKHGYYKLPGGGIDDGEDVITALERECLEEIGCHVKVGKDVGKIEEYRKMYNLHQISYCYMARVVGEKGMPEFTESEKANDFAMVWISLSEAVNLLETCNPDNKEGRDYIVPRDKCLLAEALKIMNV